MAITASSVLASNSLEDFRIEFNNLVTDVNAIQLANTFDTRIIFEGSTVDGFETALTLVDPTADRSIVLPNVSGNLIVDGNPISANGESLGTASLEWSDAFFADGSILYFGADQDVTLTHVADTGLLLNTTMVVQFRDSAINIGSPADGDLDINADDEIELNSTLIDINGNVEISGTTAQVGVLTTTATQVATGGITSGSNIVSDTDSTDDLGTTSVRWANLFVDAITATDQITATGFTGTLDGILGSGAAAAASVTTLGASGLVTAAAKIDMNGTEIILDADADTSITADTDDQIDIRIAGADDFKFTANTFTALAGSSIVIPASGLTIGSTAMTSTAAELNLLDNVSGLVQADFTKLAAVDATAAELNILDASAGNTAVASDIASSAGAITSNNAKISHTITLNANLADDAIHADIVVTNNKVLATSVVMASASIAVGLNIHTVVAGSFKVSITNLTGAQMDDDSTLIVNYRVI